MLLKDRVCIVTGGSSGIGRGIALECASEGARVAVVDKQEAPLRGKYHETDVTTPTVAEIEKLGAQGIFLQTDVADASQVADAIQQTVEHFGGLDILVNNAGIHIPGGAQDISIADWDKSCRGQPPRRFRRDETRNSTSKAIEIWKDYPDRLCPCLRRRCGPCVCPRESRARQHGPRHGVGNRGIRYNRQRHLSRLY